MYIAQVRGTNWMCKVGAELVPEIWSIISDMLSSITEDSREKAATPFSVLVVDVFSLESLQSESPTPSNSQLFCALDDCDIMLDAEQLYRTLLHDLTEEEFESKETSLRQMASAIQLLRMCNG